MYARHLCGHLRSGLNENTRHRRSRWREGKEMKLYQINEDDLAELERTLPQFMSDLMPLMADDNQRAPRLRTQFRRVQEIMQNVRWNYGPWSGVEASEGVE